MVFYFTATGNSLYIAKHFDKNPISIPQMIHQDNLVFEDETIGIICPIFGHEPPFMVRDFLQNAVFKTNYFYMILTYGNRHGGAASLTANIAAESGVRVDYIHTALMVDNFLPAFDMDEQKKIDKNVDAQIAVAKADIIGRKQEIPAATEEDIRVHNEFLARSGNPFLQKQNGFLFNKLFNIKENCVGCGICNSVCPENGFVIADGKATRNNESTCQLCMACIHHCPQKSITMLPGEKNPNSRYRNEHISLREIIAANNQNQ